MNPSPLELIAAGLFAVAIIHTFASKFFERLAHTRPTHAGLWHLLGEVEIVFAFWAIVLVLAMFFMVGPKDAIAYMNQRDFTEPMFVFAIMVIAATRPILEAATGTVKFLAKGLPLLGLQGFFVTVLAVVPLLGSFITEPAAMTLAALLLSQNVFNKDISTKLKYATLGVLFVNVSIGGTLTPFAAPPVLMVAEKWQWDVSFMLANFGWKAAIAVTVNAVVTTLMFRDELAQRSLDSTEHRLEKTPLVLTLVHFVFLGAVVAVAHYPTLFMGLFLVFLGIASAYAKFQDRLILREGLLVACFLAGLVVLGGLQRWWLQPLLLSMNDDAVFAGATVLTAFTDNAALTYLGSLVEGLSDPFKYALVAGAVTGGGLTIIANAPNPAGFSILKGHFADESVHPIGLFIAALPATLVAVVAFRFL